MSIDTPSDAAIEEALRRAEPNCRPDWTPADLRRYATDRVHSWPRAILAHAKTLQEADRVAREMADCPNATVKSFDFLLRSLMLPDPPDPDERLAREIRDEVAANYRDHNPAFAAALATIKRLREQGRLTDAE